MHEQEALPLNQLADIPSTILVIEDEENIASLVKYCLEKAHFRVLVAEDGAKGLDMYTREHPDLVVLDRMLPKVSGDEVLHQIRRWSQTPVLMLTALRTEEKRVEGLDLGADDYLTKPFGSRELVSRVRAILRRVNPHAAPPADVLQFEGLSINPKTRRVEVAGKEVELTAKEFLLLLTLASAPDQVFSRDALLSRVWGFEYLGDSRTVDVHIGTLRRKIEHDPTQPDYIKTLWRVGYKFDPRGVAETNSAEDPHG
jgi:DNA-binding response OmpR family regulator